MAMELFEFFKKERRMADGKIEPSTVHFFYVHHDLGADVTFELLALWGEIILYYNKTGKLPKFPELEKPETPKFPKWRLTSNGNFRKAPLIDANNVILVIKAGAILQQFGENEQWIQTEFAGKMGWVHKSLLVKENTK